MSNNIAKIHPAIAREVGLVERSIEMAETAFKQVQEGAEARICNVMLSAARTLQNGARLRVTQRLAAGKIALQEAKLIEGTAG